MRPQRIGLSAIGAVALLSVVIAGATMWLFLTDPVTVANAVNERDMAPFAADLVRVILDALLGLLKYL